ncbi:MAG: response regulator [Acidobacteriota bacterium]
MGKRLALVIDDELDIRNHISAVLEDHGWDVQTAGTSEEADQVIQDTRPDLILLDLVMPGRGGPMFFARLRGDDRTKSIPVIMVTGIREQLHIDWKEFVGKLKARVPDGFIEKPIDARELANMVERVTAGGIGAQSS